MNVQSSPSNPAWQIERAKKLQRACQCLVAAKLRGEKLSLAIRRVSRRYHGRPFKSDSARRFALAPGTLRHLWDKWKRAGESPAAFALKYYGRLPGIPRPLLIRFVKFCAGHRLPSVKESWLRFSRLPQNARAKEFSYGQLCYSFSAANFYLMQAELKCIAKAHARLNKIQFATIAGITNRLQERVPTQRGNRDSRSK